jgi:hypothetical protein
MVGDLLETRVVNVWLPPKVLLKMVAMFVLLSLNALGEEVAPATSNKGKYLALARGLVGSCSIV